VRVICLYVSGAELVVSTFTNFFNRAVDSNPLLLIQHKGRRRHIFLHPRQQIQVGRSSWGASSVANAMLVHRKAFIAMEPRTVVSDGD
jgi:hypothetical protein